MSGYIHADNQTGPQPGNIFQGAITQLPPSMIVGMQPKQF